jgi:hypothetical protein
VGVERGEQMEQGPPMRQFNSEVDNLFEAFHQYKHYVGSYPEGNNAQIAKALLQAKTQEDHHPRGEESRVERQGEIVDPWGTPLKIYFANSEVLIRSAGPNKQFEDSKAGIIDDYFRPTKRHAARKVPVSRFACGQAHIRADDPGGSLGQKGHSRFSNSNNAGDRSLPSPRFQSESKYKRRKPISVRISEAMRRS